MQNRRSKMADRGRGVDIASTGDAGGTDAQMQNRRSKMADRGRGVDIASTGDVGGTDASVSGVTSSSNRLTSDF
jgi:hypothetical protein